MTPQQATLVQSTFSSLGLRAEDVAEAFYERLFLLAPGLKRLFEADMKEQGRKLMQMLTLAVNALCRFYEIVPAVQELESGTRGMASGTRTTTRWAPRYFRRSRQASAMLLHRT